MRSGAGQDPPLRVYGADGERLEADQVRFAAAPTGGLPWRSGTALVGTETLGMPLDAALTWAGLLGFRYEPGAAAPLPAPWTAPDTEHEVARVWQLPRYTHDEREPVAVGFDGTFEAEVDDLELVVAFALPPPTTGEVELCTDFEEWERAGRRSPRLSSTSPSASPVTPARSRGPTRCRSRTRS